MSSNPLSLKSTNFFPRTWFVSAVVVLILAGLVWIWLAVLGRVTKEHTFTAEPTEGDQPSALQDRFPADFGNLADIVPVLNLRKVSADAPDQVEDTHSPEFRALAFINQHESDWTLQVMNVTKESVITDFLAKRSDRGRFQYFRYKKGTPDESYILTYGDFTVVQTAMGALQSMNFGLPATVKVFPERFSTYKPYVSDSDEKMVDLSASGPRQVRLRVVAIPPPAPVDSIEKKIAELADDSATPSAGAVPPSTGKLPSSVDGFSGTPDAPADAPPPAPAPKSKSTTPDAAPVQDPFN